MYERQLIRAVATLVLLVGVSLGAWADDFEDGLAAADRGDYATALRVWKPLAEQGDAWAQINLGVLYEKGLGVAQNDIEAMHWYRLSARQGLPEAQNAIGLFYEGGYVTGNDTDAAKWYRLGAEQGYADAQYNLGRMYYKGAGVPKDDVLAYMWLNLAAAQGHANATIFRDGLAEASLSPAQIQEAQRLAREWLEAHPQ